MIYTVTVNPALDLTITCDKPIRPTTFKDAVERRHAGGKGIDVSRVIRNLGGRSVAMGFLGGFTGRSVEGMLLAEGLELNFIRIAEETRTNVVINAPDNPKEKEMKDHRFNSQGPKVQAIETWELFDKFLQLQTVTQDRKPTHVAVCGSLSHGMDPNYYSNVVRSFRDLGAKVYLDTSRDALRRALDFPPPPDVVKPNLDEFDDLMDRALSRRFDARRKGGESDEELLDRLASEPGCRGAVASDSEFWTAFLEQLSAFFYEFKGVQTLMVTLGKEGIVVASGDDKVEHGMFNPPEDFHVVSTVGAGDTALAAFIWALEDGKTREEALRWAVAASAGAVTTDGTSAPTKKQVEEYLELVTAHTHYIPNRLANSATSTGSKPNPRKARNRKAKR